MVSPKCTTSSLPVRKGPMTFLQNLHRYLGEKDLFILQAVLEDREQLSTRGRISEPDSPSDAYITTAHQVHVRVFMSGVQKRKKSFWRCQQLKVISAQLTATAGTRSHSVAGCRSKFKQYADCPRVFTHKHSNY